VISAGKIHIGTSGWSYDDWKGKFYPVDIPKTRWFEYYSKHFKTVELNSTFYHLPNPKTIRKWKFNTPAGFIYSVKASRYITHIKRLKDCAEPVERFFRAIKPLKPETGAVLYQLPPNSKLNLDRLEDFIKLLPKKYNHVFEFRNKSWYCRDISKLLDKYGCGFCIHDMQKLESPKWITGELLYVRFHGSEGKYRGSYPYQKLSSFAKWTKQNNRKIKQGFVYFNNDYNANASKNALYLKKYFEQYE
jgi:uncharacterized protein YecE (DUF72 family)